jgi:hypothetical protein
MAEEDRIIKYIINSVGNTPLSIARLFKELYSKEFRLVSDNKKNAKLIWQEFIEDTWKPMVKTFELHKRLTEQITRYIDAARGIVRSQRLKSQGTDSDTRDFLEAHMRILHSVEHSLYNITFRNKVIRECELLFYERTESA